MSDLYEKDLVEWSLFQATLIREGRYEELDYPSIAEELESFQTCHRSLLRHALADLCFCIALHRARPETEVWCYVQAGDAGVRLGSLLEVSPSLTPYAAEFLEQAWKIAVGRVEEMFPGAVIRPEALGYTVNGLLNRCFVPELEGRPNLTVVEGSARGDVGSGG
jgi:hypothetical protein